MRNRPLTYKLLYFKSINRRFSPENDDICHVNDLYIANDKLYVSMFSYPPKKNHLSFANKTNLGVILEYSLQERKVVKICPKKFMEYWLFKYSKKSYFSVDHFLYLFSRLFSTFQNYSSMFL
ncbi:hypothetical protein FB545_1996 [Peribacillus frigoritolerans]|nr:hypothetical protein FB545_1996 [Peribacillus frigoritolerans]